MDTGEFSSRKTSTLKMNMNFSLSLEGKYGMEVFHRISKIAIKNDLFHIFCSVHNSPSHEQILTSSCIVRVWCSHKIIHYIMKK